MVVILIFLLLPIALTFFLPFQPVCFFMAFWCGAAALLFGAGSLYAFDVTDPDDWKMLAVSLILPGGACALLVWLGKALGDLVMWDLLQMIFG